MSYLLNSTDPQTGQTVIAETTLLSHFSVDFYLFKHTSMGPSARAQFLRELERDGIAESNSSDWEIDGPGYDVIVLKND